MPKKSGSVSFFADFFLLYKKITDCGHTLRFFQHITCNEYNNRKAGFFMDSLYIIIPAYNEEETVLNVIHGWYPIIERYHGDGASRLVIINDGSTDHTANILEEAAKTRPFLTTITKEKSGHGATVLFG